MCESTICCLGVLEVRCQVLVLGARAEGLGVGDSGLGVRGQVSSVGGQGLGVSPP